MPQQKDVEHGLDDAHQALCLQRVLAIRSKGCDDGLAEGKDDGGHVRRLDPQKTSQEALKLSG